MPSIKKNRGGVNTDGFPEKLLSLTKYDMKLLTGLYLSKKNKMVIERAASNLVARYFEAYIDSKARANPKSLHHVYEFDMAGKKDSRLFKRNVSTGVGGTTISYKLINAKLPNREGYPFPQKARIMEDGLTVTIRPKGSGYLQYRLADGRFVKTRKPSVVTNPGGDVANNFTSEFNNYMLRRAKSVLKEYRFFERINDNYRMKRKLIMPRINNLSIIDPTMSAISDANQIALASGEVFR